MGLTGIFGHPGSLNIRRKKFLSKLCSPYSFRKNNPWSQLFQEKMIFSFQNSKKSKHPPPYAYHHTYEKHFLFSPFIVPCKNTPELTLRAGLPSEAMWLESELGAIDQIVGPFVT